MAHRKRAFPQQVMIFVPGRRQFLSWHADYFQVDRHLLEESEVCRLFWSQHAGCIVLNRHHLPGTGYFWLLLEGSSSMENTAMPKNVTAGTIQGHLAKKKQPCPRILSMTKPRALGWSWGDGLFLMSEVPLHCQIGIVMFCVAAVEQTWHIRGSQSQKFEVRFQVKVLKYLKLSLGIRPEIGRCSCHWRTYLWGTWGLQTFYKLKCWVCGTNPSILSFGRTGNRVILLSLKDISLRDVRFWIVSGICTILFSSITCRRYHFWLSVVYFISISIFL